MGEEAVQKEPIVPTQPVRRNIVGKFIKNIAKISTAWKVESALASLARKQNQGNQANFKRVLGLNCLKPGVLHGSDPFFWFLNGNMTCYPPLTLANAAIIQPHQMII